jgi:hypothetical protein
MAPESSRKRLPFEPGSKSAKADSAAPKAPSRPSAKPVIQSGTGSPTKRAKGTKTAIPEEVSGRMLRRMLVFSGVPTVLGILTFFVSYYLVVNRMVELPSYFVLLITLGCFGLGVVGLTYGVLSASWDEGRLGTMLGLDEFQVNFGRMTSAWGAKSER